jgi:hypothetical protein
VGTPSSSTENHGEQIAVMNKELTIAASKSFERDICSSEISKEEVSAGDGDSVLESDCGDDCKV